MENIPQTNFHVKRAVNNDKCKECAFWAVIFLLAILHIKYFEELFNWIDSLTYLPLKSLLLYFTNPQSLFISGIVVILLFGVGLYHLIKTQKNKNIFRKLSVQGNEIEIFGEDDNSYFDKYLNEVLYLFENSGYDVVVFEDLDRFDNNKIFERLREINILSNIRLQNSQDRIPCEPLRFFYLLRDDIFINKDRTKFFDFILPVVPVLDGSNAYDQIKRYFEESGVFEIFEEKFLREFSRYINDMRVLKNIYNEFMVYFNKLNTIELNPNKMLAMITYKNLFPRDFSDLQLEQGFVFELFNQKEQFVKKEKAECEEKISEKEKQIVYLKKEQLELIVELDDVNEAKKRRLPSRYDSQYTEKMKEYDEWLKNEYPLRKKAIEDKLENRLSKLEEELLRLQEQKRILTNKKLYEIITRENVDEIFALSSKNGIGEVNKYESIKISESFALLRYLIWNGYIDETYSDYMTFFYENSLTKGDKMFLRSVTDRKAKPFSYTLDDVKLVISNLYLSDFDQEEVLNFDLLEYLLNHEEKREALICFVRQLKREARYQFISEYFAENRSRAKFVIILNDQWPEFFGQVVSEQKMTVQQIRDYSVATLEYMEGESLLAVNVDGCLTSYINSQEDYLNIKGSNLAKLSYALISLQVSFKQLNYQVSNKALFQEVYYSSLFEINAANISLMLEVKYRLQNIEEALKQCITSVFSKQEQPLCGYMQRNMDAFIEAVLSIPEVEFTDSSADAVMVINNDDITEEHKLAYIKRLATLIDSLSDIDEEKYQTELVGKMGVQYTVENIMEYFGKVGMTDNLADFINSGHECLDYQEQDDQKLLDNFWKQCITNGKLSSKKYKEILLSISPDYPEFNVAGVPSNKMKILIEENFIPMTKGTLTFMRSNYADSKMAYIIGNMTEYMDIAIGNMASAEEVKTILSYDEFDDETKIKLLSEVKDKISIVNRNYSDQVMAHILKNNLVEADLPALYQDYKHYGVATQHEILAIAKRNMIKVISASRNISKDMVRELLKDTSISESNRVDLFIAMLEEASDDDCKQYLESFGMPEMSKIFEYNRRPKIPITSANQKILSALKEEGFIDDFKEDEETSMYKITRRKTAKPEHTNTA